jgi:DNA polymerase-3 subunit epsilon
MKYAIVDIETSGGSWQRDRITEIAIYIHNGNGITNEFKSLVNPEAPIPYYITRLTGITNEMVAKAPKFYEIAREVVLLTEGCVFVAHNAPFDYRFVQAEFKRLGYDYHRDVLCTVRLSRRVFPGYRSYSLGNICDGLGIEIESRHRAAGDALATAKLFEKILSETKGDFRAYINPTKSKF